MRYQDSAATWLDHDASTAPRRAQRPALEVVRGRGLDARARQGVSRTFLSRARLVAVAIACLSVLGVVRVGLYSSAVSTLGTNASVRTELKQARALQDDLRIERSVLSSGSRIERIATQNYGMVLDADPEQLTISTPSEPARPSLAEAVARQGASPADAGALAAAGATRAQDASATAEADAAATGAALDASAVTQGDGTTAGSNAVTESELLGSGR